MNIIGDWHIDYVETGTKTLISFYPDGTFFQIVGQYMGKWLLKQNILSLQFDSITLSNENGSVILEASISNDYKSFSGIKPNNLYTGGLLHYNATFLGTVPTSLLYRSVPGTINYLPLNGPTLKDYYTTTARITQGTQATRATQATQVTQGTQGTLDEEDSPCQVRRKNRKR
jgi:hypothetical protein